MQAVFTRILGYFCISLLVMAFECEDRLSIPVNSTFREKVDLFPTQKQYKIGDTLWIRYTNLTNSFFDTLSMQPITADRLSFNFYTSVTSLHTNPAILDRSFCDYLTARGYNVDRTITSYGAVCNLNIGCDTTGYGFTIGIILKQEGIYRLDLANLDVSGGASAIWSCPNQTTAFPPATITFRFNVPDGNKDVYLLLPASKRDDYTMKQIDDKKIYIVQVVK